MKKTRVIILSVVFLCLCKLIFGQELKNIDYLAEIKKHNMTDLWRAEHFDSLGNFEFTSHVVGFIGTDYQRFYIHFNSIIQNPKNKLQYFIYGKTKVKSNICSFQGLINITESKYHLIDGFKEGYAKGEYEFYENPNEPKTGILIGTFQTDFLINANGSLDYGDYAFADGYFNNRFVGTWSDYKTGKTKTCNWGTEGIPDESGRLVTVAPTWFLPDDKFANYGWDNYIKAYTIEEPTSENAAARKIEEEKWWLEK